MLWADKHLVKLCLKTTEKEQMTVLHNIHIVLLFNMPGRAFHSKMYVKCSLPKMPRCCPAFFGTLRHSGRYYQGVN